MEIDSDANIEGTLKWFLRLQAILLAVFEILIDGTLEIVNKAGHAFTFERNQGLYPIDLTMENSILLREGNTSRVSLIMKMVHVK